MKRSLNSLLLLFVVGILMFSWYKYSNLSNAAIQTASFMETIPSFGQNQTNQIISIETSKIESFPEANSPKYDTPKYEVKDMLNNGNLGELVIDSLGMFLYMGIALIGVLIMMRYSSLNKSWSILCIGTLIISFVPPLLGFSILKERWWFLSQVFLAIPLGACLTAMNKKIAVCLASVIVVFSIIGLPVNITDRTLSPNLIMRYALTDNEMEGLKIVEERYPGKYELLGSDSFYISYVQSDIKWFYPKRTKVASLDENIMSGDFRSCKCDIILLRDATYKEPYAFGNGAIYKVEYNPIELAKLQGYKEIWSNEEITCLVRE